MSTTSTTGRPRHRGDVGGRGEPVAADLPVVQAHDALDDGEVGAACAVQQQRDEPLLADEVRVEVAAGAAGGERVVAGVDVVGADLVAGHVVAGAAQRRHQAGGDRRLAVPGRRGGDDEAGQGSPLDAPLALLAVVERVLDVLHLGDEVGDLDEPRVGAAAGDDDVLVPGPVGERLDDVVDVDPAPLHRVGELVEHVEVVRSRRRGGA